MKYHSFNKNHSRNIFIIYLLYINYILFFPSFIQGQNVANYSNTTNETEAYDTSDSFEYKCEGRTLRYPISANLSKYLENLSKNGSEVEDNIIITSLDNITTIGVMEATIFEYIIKVANVSNVITFNSYLEIQSALKEHSIDAIFISKQIGDMIRLNNDDLIYFDYNETNEDNILKYKFFINNNDIRERFNDVLNEHLTQLRRIWFGFNTGIKHINTVLTGDRGNLTVALNFNDPPFSYIDNNGEKAGLMVDLVYRLANSTGYRYIDFINIHEFDQLMRIIENDETDIAGILTFDYYFKNKTNAQILLDDETRSVIVIRYDNSNETYYWKEPYTSFEQFNNDKLGAYKDTFNLTRQVFNSAQIVNVDHIEDLYNLLLLKEIDGFLADKSVALFYENNVSNRLTHFDRVLGKNYFGFIFVNESIKEEFNEYIFELKNQTNMTSLAISLEVNETIYETVTNETNNETEKINIIISNYLRPFVYFEEETYKGYETYLILNFAYLYNYSVTFNNENETNKVYIGVNKILQTDLGFYSDPLYESDVVLETRKEKLKDTFKISVLSNSYKEKSVNNVLIPISFSNLSKIVMCTFPEKYDYNIDIQCLITGIFLKNQFRGEYAYGDTKNRIKLMYRTIDANKFLKANDYFPNDNIINHFNLTGVICPEFEINTSTNNITKKSYRITTSSIIGMVIVGILFISAVITIIIMYRKDFTTKKFEFENSSSNINDSK